MERGKPKTPKRRVQSRTHLPLTPDIERNVADSSMIAHVSRHRQRATMAPTDFAMPQSTTKKRIGLDRTHRSTDGSSATVSENNDIELKLLYDQYLQNVLTKEILRRKQQEKMQLFYIQLATISKECDELREKLYKLKMRERDITNLTKVQTDIDSQIAVTNKCTRKEDIKALECTLSQLYRLIKPFDVLRVSNIIVPDTVEDWCKIREILESCSETLNSIIGIIGSKMDSYESVSESVKEFIGIFNDIKEHHQRLEKEVPILQFLVLKNASLALTEDQNE